MRIQNLGPIKDGTVQLNRLTVLTGNNGTGKTLAAYSLFAFRYWLENQFTPNLVTEAQIQQIIAGEPVTNTVDYYLSVLEKQLIDNFNKLNDSESFYQNFFRDDSVYVSGTTKLTINKHDISELILPKEKRLNWFYRWDYNLETDSIEGQSSVNNLIENRIYSTYLDKSDSIFTYYDVEGGKQEQSGVSQAPSMSQATKLVSGNIFNDLFASRKTSFYMPAERIGINVFRNRLNNQIVNDSLQVPVANANQIETTTSANERYPYPIEAYIKYINNSLGRLKEPLDKRVQDEKLKALVDGLVPGEFVYDEVKNEVNYNLPDQTENRTVTFNLLSSSLKSLFGIDIFIRNIGEGNWLFIDEPEMNLHPTRQVMMMDFLYQLAAIGTNVVISTHSDYLVKELMNLMLADKVKENTATSQLVRVYNFEASTITDLGDITDDDVELANFDITTDQINNRYYGLIDQLDKRGSTHES
ncbi:AAA family ATPase [Lactiplantibacillus dongliensis]|uniref:AAA family ATPase n=1 Tax=Lactiplantibacillus dongliensis TaxID=2559919 RepID=A0ABW1RAZ6_9LACO|nr:AAA family ATPase [Lactiplantibacillus dongliensis]